MSNSDQESKVLRRADAREFIRQQGLPIGEKALDNLANAGKGPKFVYGKGGESLRGR